MASNSSTFPTDVIISAPGKVLFAGGFLVLDRQHTGLVFGLDARIHVAIDGWDEDDNPQPPTKQPSENVVFVGVHSPQFYMAKWLYSVSVLHTTESHLGPLHLEQVTDVDYWSNSKNKFVEITLRYALTYLLHIGRPLNNSVRITILADNDYYSKTAAAATSKDFSLYNRFTDFGLPLSDAHKTGLGSSAALVTALVAGLTTYLGLVEGDTADSRLPLKRIHNLAQAAHCAAQGKVGSGFDVAAAVYGSCLYRRFSPSILESVGEFSAPDFGSKLHRCVDDLELDRKWDVEIGSHAVKIPKSLVLVMCDVDCGSETPGMVRKVLQWRKEKSEEAGLLWTAIQQGMNELCGELGRLADLEGIMSDSFSNLGDILLTIRSLVREMSVKSQVPVEPPVITELLDFCTSIPGVVGGVAPGAGGYDAVALLVKNDGDTLKHLQERLHGWKSQDKDGAIIGNVSLLGVKQGTEGVKVMRDWSIYLGWL